MPQIGQFTRTKSGYSGRVRTLTLDAELALLPAEPPTPRTRRTTASISATKTAPRSAPAGNAPARRLASMSRCCSTIPSSRSRSAPTCSSPATTRQPGACTGTARRSAASGTEAMRTLHPPRRRFVDTGRTRAARHLPILLLSGLLFAAGLPVATLAQSAPVHRTDPADPIRRLHRRSLAALRHSGRLDSRRHARRKRGRCARDLLERVRWD